MAIPNLWNDKRLRLTLTRLGLEYLAALLLVGFFAVNSGNNLLYLVFALMLGLFVVSGWVSRKAIRGLRFESLDEGTLFARVKGGIRIRLHDEAPGRARGLEVDLALDGVRVDPGFYGRGQRGQASAMIVLAARPEARGWCRARQLELRTRFPFGFLEKAWRISLDREILVLPHPRSVPSQRESEGTSQRFLPTPGTTSPEGTRPFRVGDAMGRVHWKRTAQRGEPWIRTFEGEQPTGLRLRLDVRQWAPGPGFEEELEKLSGAILQARLQKQEVSLGLREADGYREFAGPTECWRALAVTRAQGGAASADSAAFPGQGLAIP